MVLTQFIFKLQLVVEVVLQGELTTIKQVENLLEQAVDLELTYPIKYLLLLQAKQYLIQLVLVEQQEIKQQILNNHV
jgi:hypothetical protein